MVWILAAPSWAQSEGGDGLSALPFESPQRRITPENGNNDEGILTTKPVTPALPWQSGGAAPAAGTAAAPKPATPAAIPFGRASGGIEGPPIAAQPHANAVPVENIDASIEQQDAAPPEPPPPGANPADEDPAQPTELTAPLFNGPDSGEPRTVLLRALNKVTAQAQLLEGHPGDTLKFGQLLITPAACRKSDATSQLDYAGLIDIKEAVPGKKDLQPLFRGWMYASSPSVNALEHPVYDLSMVECKISQPAKKEEPKKAEKSKKK